MSKMMIVAATSEKMLELMDKITIEEGVISFLASNKATAKGYPCMFSVEGKTTTASVKFEAKIKGLDEKGEVGANPVVSAAESIDVTIVCEIHKTAGYTEETVKSQIQTDVQAHFLEIAFQSGVISLNFFKVSNIISAVSGVSEVVDLTINGKKDSITADYNKFFSLKGVIISVTE